MVCSKSIEDVAIYKLSIARLWANSTQRRQPLQHYRCLFDRQLSYYSLERLLKFSLIDWPYITRFSARFPGESNKNLIYRVWIKEGVDASISLAKNLDKVVPESCFIVSYPEHLIAFVIIKLRNCMAN